MTFSLVADGPFDEVLIPIISWSLKGMGVSVIEGVWADFRRLPSPPKTLADKLTKCLELYPAELIFVHRDSEGEPPEHRYEEIERARREVQLLSLVPIVPVRMTEAWLLGDEQAIRAAAGNPNGKEPLPMPRIRDLEAIADPKDLLLALLGQASGLNVRRMASLKLPYLARRVVDYTDDFAHLHTLSAFMSFQSSLRTKLSEKQNADSAAAAPDADPS